MKHILMKHAFLAALAGALGIASAHAQWWNRMDPTPMKDRGTEREAKVVYDRALINQAQMTVSAAFWDQDFEKIERMHEEFVQKSLRTVDGTWMVEAVQAAFRGMHLGDPARLEKYLAAWESKFPQSILRPVVAAYIARERAWKARGGGYAATITNEGMRIFREQLAQTVRMLDACAPACKATPLWYGVGLQAVAMSASDPREVDALFREAVQRYPGYRPIYSIRVNYLIPKWGGDWDQVDRFIGAAASATNASDGDALYALLYSDIASDSRLDFLNETRVSWPRMKKGFQDLVDRYPDNMNRNLFATVACQVRDKETTARLLTELGAKASLGAKVDGITTEGCRRFAFLVA